MCRAACGTILGAGILFLLLSTTAIAEPATFDLSSYRPTGYADWMWPVTAGTQWYDNGNTRLNHPFDIIRDFTQKDDQSSRDVSLEMYPRYEYQGTERWLLLSSDMYGELNHYKRTSSSVQTRDYSPTDLRIYATESSDEYGSKTFNINNNAELGRYFKGDWLISFDGALNYSYQATPDRKDKYSTYLRLYSPALTWERTSQDTKQSTYYRTTTLNLAVLPGYGRVYDGSFAYTAVAMIDELRKAGKLLREPTHDEMMGLTDLIFKRRQTHAVDGRLHHNESLVAIADYLRTAGVTGDLGAAGVVLIADVWDYFPRAATIGAGYTYYQPGDWSLTPGTIGIARPFGWRVRAGVGIEYRRWRYTSTANNIYATSTDAGPGPTEALYFKEWRIDTDRLPYVTGIAEYHRPINEHWQFDGELVGRLGFDPAGKDSTYRTYITETDTEQRSDFTVRNLESSQMFSLGGSLGYHFDGRTSLTGGLNYQAGHDSYSFRHMFVVDAVEYENEGGDRTSDWHVFQVYASAVYRWRVPTSLEADVYYQDIGGLDYPQESYDEYDAHVFGFDLFITHYLF